MLEFLEAQLVTPSFLLNINNIGNRQMKVFVFWFFVCFMEVTFRLRKLILKSRSLVGKPNGFPKTAGEHNLPTQ